MALKYGLAAFILAMLAMALQPAVEHWMRPRHSILIDQLLGRGCQYQEPYSQGAYLNPLTTLGIRNPDFACPMWAAAHLAELRVAGKLRDRVLQAFEQALHRKPAEFDTGDGVIPYGRTLREAQTQFLRVNGPSDGKESGK
jgi:hypothetical protein